jgi:hypothetical protein
MVCAFERDHLEVESLRPEVVRHAEGDIEFYASQGFALPPGYYPVEGDVAVLQLSF